MRCQFYLQVYSRVPISVLRKTPANRIYLPVVTSDADSAKPVRSDEGAAAEDGITGAPAAGIVGGITGVAGSLPFSGTFNY